MLSMFLNLSLTMKEAILPAKLATTSLILIYAVISRSAAGLTWAANSIAGPEPRDLPNSIMSELRMPNSCVRYIQTDRASSIILSADVVPG